MKQEKGKCNQPSCRTASEPLPVKESLLRAVKYFRETKYSWNATSARTWTSVSDHRHFPLKQKAVALWADSWSTLSALLGIRHWRRGMHMPLGPASFGPGQPGHSSAAEECSDHCDFFCYSSLILHPPLSIAFLLWAGIGSLYMFEQQKGNWTLFCGVQNNGCHTIKSQK